MKSIWFYIIASVLLLPFSVCGQHSAEADTTAAIREVRYDSASVSVKTFDLEKLKVYKDQEAFNYLEETPPDTFWTRFKTWLNDLWKRFIDWLLQGEEATGLLGFLVKALPYLLVAGVIALLVWLFLKVDLGGSPLKRADLNKVILADEQEIIENQNIPDLIQAALNEKNYRLAVRFYYLLLLQKLAQKDLIDWQAQKTNADYVYELKDNKLRNNFTRLTRIYDFIWYGNFEVNETDFAKAEHEFKTVTASL